MFGKFYRPVISVKNISALHYKEFRTNEEQFMIHDMDDIHRTKMSETSFM